MAKKTHPGKFNNSVSECLIHRETPPRSFLDRRIASVKRRFSERAREGQGISARYAEYWRQLQEAGKRGDDLRKSRALDGILEIHRNLAKRKIPAARPQLGQGGLITTTFGVKLTPPFDYVFTVTGAIKEGNPALAASADKDTGQISVSAVTDYNAPSEGNCHSEVGIYFRPKFGPATLRAYISPSCTYQWWTNSIEDSRVLSLGTAEFGIVAGENLYGWRDFLVWSVNNRDELQFDFAIDSVLPVVLQVDQLDPSMDYAVYVSIGNWIVGEGWPGSLAGAITSIALPSITIELNPLVLAGA